MGKAIRFLCFLSIISDTFGLFFGKFSLFLKLVLVIALIAHAMQNGTSLYTNFFVFFIGISLLYQFTFRANSLVTEVSWFSRILLVTLIMDNSALFKKQRFVFTYFTLSYLFLAGTTIISYFLGIGKPMYGNEGIGTRGFYVAGNELSFLLLVNSVFFLSHFMQSRQYWRMLMIILVSIFISVILATKVAFIGFVFVTIITLLVSLVNSVDLKRMSILKKEFILSLPLLLGFLLFLPFAVDFLLQKVGLIDRIDYALRKFDLMTVIMSGRNVKIVLLLDYIRTADILTVLFGMGEVEMMSMFNQTTETDFFDFLGFYGLFGLLGFISYLCYIYKRVRPKLLYRFIYFLFMLISFLAGHVFSSGVAAIPLALLLINVNDENFNSHRGSTSNH